MAGRTRGEWRGIVGELERSELTTREFALKRGVNPRTLTWWKSQLRRETKTVEFIDIPMAQDARPFVVHLDGAAVEVPRGFDPGDFERIVSVLDARC